MVGVRSVMLPLLLLASLLGGWQAVYGKTPNSLKPHVADSKLYAVCKPEGWKVGEEQREDSLRVQVKAPDETSLVDFFWARNKEGKPDALRFLAAYKKYLSQTRREVSLSEVFVAKDSSRATATFRYRLGQITVKGKYYFESGPKQLSAQGYCAPENLFASERPLLLNIMASFAFAKGPAVTGAQGKYQPSAIQYVQVPLVSRQAQDGSVRMKVPADWNFLAAGGKVVTGAPDGSAGFISTVIQGLPQARGASIAQGVIAAPYQPPTQAMAMIFSAFGHRNFQVRSCRPDNDTNRAFPAYVGRKCDAQDMMVSWTSSQGARCLGAFKAINALPSAMGQWFCMVSGLWGPEKDFYRYFPLLEQVAGSFAINDQYARKYIQAGLENLRVLQQKTLQSMRELSSAREQNQKDWEARQARKDFMDSKWDDYRRGRSYWVSELEGGKVYETDPWGTKDTSTGQYYEGSPYNWNNFEGQNPRHPSESMREVSSYELQRME